MPNAPIAPAAPSIQVPVNLFFKVTPGWTQTGTETAPITTTPDQIQLALQAALVAYGETITAPTIDGATAFTVDSVRWQPGP